MEKAVLVVVFEIMVIWLYQLSWKCKLATVMRLMFILIPTIWPYHSLYYSTCKLTNLSALGRYSIHIYMYLALQTCDQQPTSCSAQSTSSSLLLLWDSFSFTMVKNTSHTIHVRSNWFCTWTQSKYMYYMYAVILLFPPPSPPPYGPARNFLGKP